MKLSYPIISILAALASAAPTTKDVAAPPKYTDIELLNFVLHLEHFQDAFYRQGLANYTDAQFADAGYDAQFYKALEEIAVIQHTHVTALATTIQSFNATAIDECQYNFLVTNPKEFVGTANLVQSVAASAYIGLLPSFGNPMFETLFAAALSVEARQAAFIRSAIHKNPFPSIYDAPLTLRETFTLTQLYSPSCPQNPLDLESYMTLSLAFTNFDSHGNEGSAAGLEATFLTYGVDVKACSDDTPLYAVFLTVSGPIFAPTIRLPENGGFNVTVPQTPQGFVPISGLTYVVLSTSNATLTDDNIIAGPASIEIWPN